MKVNYFLLFICILIMSSCSRPSNKSDNKKSPNNPEVVVSNSLIDENETVNDTSFSHILNIDLASQSLSSSSLTSSIEVSGVTFFYLDGNEVASLTKDSIGISLNIYFPKNIFVEIKISGTLSGAVSINNTEKMKLVLSNASITSIDGPALNIQSHKKTFLILEGTNVLKDSTTYSTRYLPDGLEMDLKAALFAEGALIVSGNGSLNITGKKKHSFASDEHIIIREGTVSVTANKKDAIRVNMAFIMHNGTLSINTLANAGKGIKVEGKEDPLYPNGYIKINDGNITINSFDKGISASWETAEDAKTSGTSDDPTPYIVINGGDIDITTFGIPVDSTGDDKLTPEGIESKGNLTINNGNISINSTDDGLNSIKSTFINGGSIYVNSSHNDGLDSNELFTINGGILVLDGDEFPESGIDSNGEVFLNLGGIIVAKGGRNSTIDDTISTQNSILLNNQSVHLIMIKDLNGNLIFAYDNTEHTESVFISSPLFLDATQYNLFYGGTVDSFNTNFHGLYLNNLSSSSGTYVRTFETTGRLTNLH